MSVARSGDPPQAIAASTRTASDGEGSRPSLRPASAPDIVIAADRLSKRFKIYSNPRHRVLEWLSGGRVRRHTEFWAVRGVSLGVRRGECLGIIGANGSGKSTLLKMITGALYPTEGEASVQGRVLSLLDLGAGLNPQLTGRASVIHSARLLGFPHGYARDAMGRIEQFAELGEFFDRPVGLYSSGMRLRLVFSMFACFEPDVFVVDEALAVGDVFFQQKCATRLREMLDAGLTMLFVSHDHGAILNLCDRAILLERGRAAFEGEPAEALARYTASLRGGTRFSPGPRGGRASASAARVAAAPDDAAAIIEGDVIGDRGDSRYGTGAARVVAVRVTDGAERDSMRAFMGEPLTFHVLLEAREPVDQPRVGIQLVDRFTNLLFACGTRMLGYPLPALAPGDRLIVRLTVRMDLAPGEYSFAVGTSIPAEDPEQGVVHDQVPDLGPIRVMLDRGRPRPFHGAARLTLCAEHAIVGSAGSGPGAPR